jgi:Mrp family chromosome partitioning ATPase
VSGVPLTVLTAVEGAWEAPLVRGLEQHRDRLQVVRRCADLADVLVTAGSGRARAAVVSADLRGLDAEAVARLSSSGCAVVALTAPGDEWSERRLRQLGLTTVLAAGTGSAEVAAALQAAVAALDRRDEEPVEPIPDQPCPGPSGGEADGRLVAVWGPAGAPGRTTTAVSLAAELAALGRSTLLVDADTYAASVAQVLGLLDEAPGLVAAARAADQGSLDLATLSRLAPSVGRHLRVLTGLPQAHRWTELRAASLSRVLALCRALAAWSVVDVSASLEEDEDLVYDTAAPRRNGATRTTLEEADVLVAVGTADPVGLQRLVRGLQELADIGLRPGTVVVTRVRASAVGAARLGAGGPDRRIREALQRYAGVDQAVLVPDDVPALDTALLHGRTLVEAAPASPARAAYRELVHELAGVQVRDQRGRDRAWDRVRRPSRRTVEV